MQSLFTLCTVNLQPFTQLAEGLLPRAARRGAEDQLGVELPVLGDVPGLLHASVDQRVVVLQVGAEALSHQSGPGDVLGHTLGADGPEGEIFRVEGVLVLHALDDGAGDEEEDLCMLVLCLTLGDIREDR